VTGAVGGGGFEFAPCQSFGDPADMAERIAPWVLSAWRPYAEALDGGADQASAVCAAMMLDAASVGAPCQLTC
jgi:hypothetical protein